MKFSGKVGYGTEVNKGVGVIDIEVTERAYKGDVIRNSRTLVDGEKINNDISVDNSISIVADAYAYEHFFAIKYVIWQGVLWVVSNVDVQRPRLVLRLGGVYNGPKAATPGTP